MVVCDYKWLKPVRHLSKEQLSTISGASTYLSDKTILALQCVSLFIILLYNRTIL